MKNNLLRILTYHRVAEPAATPLLNPRIISATPSVFASQMQHLAESYNVVTMEQALAATLHQKRLPDRAVLITFDDGYFDFIDHAWPILNKLKLPSTVYIPTSYPDNPELVFWWDKLYAAFSQTVENKLQIDSLKEELLLTDNKQRMQSLKLLQNFVKTLPNNEAMDLVENVCHMLGVVDVVKQSAMNWDQLRSLHKEGVTLGAHTRTHPLLTQLSHDEVRKEIKGSCEDLKREIGDVLPVFAYPNGSHNQDVVDIVGQEGFDLSVTVIDGLNDMNTVDPLRLNRTEITQRTSSLLFKLRLQKWFSTIDEWRHRKKH